MGNDDDHHLIIKQGVMIDACGGYHITYKDGKKVFGIIIFMELIFRHLKVHQYSWARIISLTPSNGLNIYMFLKLIRPSKVEIVSRTNLAE